MTRETAVAGEGGPGDGAHRRQVQRPGYELPLE
jgi:hypothetical protein